MDGIVARLVQLTAPPLRRAMALAFLACTALLVYAALNGMPVRLGQRLVMPSQAWWVAALCLAFGAGMLSRLGGGASGSRL